MEENKRKVNEIKDNIRSLKNDLKNIQHQCDHSHTIIQFHNKSKTVRKVCAICEKLIGYPTEHELRDNDFL